VEPDRGIKSIGHEETYERDHHEHEPLRREIVRMADAVAGRLRAARLAGRTITVKVRFHDFSTITRSQTVPGAVDTGPEIARAAWTLLDQVDPTPGVRLLGVSASNLADGAARQLTLDDVGEPAWGDASRAIDEVRQRFGDGAVGPAALMGEHGLEVKRRGDQQWGPRGRRDR
jgi:DNA polymerase-4